MNKPTLDLRPQPTDHGSHRSNARETRRHCRPWCLAPVDWMRCRQTPTKLRGYTKQLNTNNCKWIHALRTYRCRCGWMNNYECIQWHTHVVYVSACVWHVMECHVDTQSQVVWCHSMDQRLFLVGGLSPTHLKNMRTSNWKKTSPIFGAKITNVWVATT